METTRAESLKNKGNEEFKNGNYTAAIKYYTEALGMNHSFILNHVSDRYRSK